ncbi:hypothetical protein MMC15_005642 [Xylographa vitiligo]|nr:hypothetical protein [Xylographa vitiligo]
MYTPTLALVFVLSLLVPSFPATNAELLPRQGGVNGATAQLSLLSTIGQSSSTMTSTSMATSTMTGSMSSTVPASVSASMASASASASVAESAAASIATHAATGGGGGSGAQGIGGASNNSAAGRAEVNWGFVGAVMAVMGAVGVL